MVTIWIGTAVWGGIIFLLAWDEYRRERSDAARRSRDLETFQERLKHYGRNVKLH